jgi:hypothetical protein
MKGQDLCERSNISIPIHNNKQLKAGLQAHQMKIAGITEKDL